MARFRLASACAFKCLCHLVHCQVLWPTYLDHPIACARILQRDASKSSNVLYSYKIDRIGAPPKDGGLPLLYEGLAYQLDPEVHEGTGAHDGEAQATGPEILLGTVLDAEELQRRIGAGTPNRHKNEVLHACGFGRIDQLTIARIINRLGIVVALSNEGMGRCQQIG